MAGDAAGRFAAVTFAADGVFTTMWAPKYGKVGEPLQGKYKVDASTKPVKVDITGGGETFHNTVTFNSDTEMVMHDPLEQKEEQKDTVLKKVP
jgi:hypothetical protein